MRLISVCLIACAGLLLWGCLEKKHEHGWKPGGPPIYTCTDLGKIYPAVKRQANGSACNTDWNVDLEPSKPTDDDHPEIGFKPKHRNEKIHFHHTKNLSITLAGNPQTAGCPHDPLKFTAHGNSVDAVFIDWPSTADDTCHYKLTFHILDQQGNEIGKIDPHISVGK